MDIYAFSDDEILHFCQNRDIHHLKMLSNESSGRKVIQITAGIVVKFGHGVTIQEASAQHFAFQKVDHEILRVPKVYRFFNRPDSESWLIGYLVMEQVEGVTVEQIIWENSTLLPRIVTALNAVNSVLYNCPGPVCGGEVNGSLWSEYGSGTAFRDINDLEFYLNRRLAYFDTEIRVRKEDLCLCHMDAAPRNFMIDLQGRLCLLDWATAGFFPRYFELWSIEFAQHVMGSNFGPGLLQQLRATPAEIMGVQKLSLVYRYNSHYAINHSSDETDMIMTAVAKADGHDSAISS